MVFPLAGRAFPLAVGAPPSSGEATMPFALPPPPREVFLLPTPQHADARRIERDGAAEAAALFAVKHEAQR